MSQMVIDEIVLANRTKIDWPIVRCTECNTVYVGKRLAGTAAEDAYHDHSYEFSRSPYADSLIDSRSHAQRVLDEIERFQPSGRLLDVGCATGTFLESAASRGWNVTGVEVSPHLAERAQQKGMVVSVGTLHEAQFEPGSFDVVTLLDVIEHLDNPATLIDEIHKVLRPGGLLVMETPNWNSVYRRTLGRWWAALQPKLHLTYFDVQTATQLLRRSHFDPVLSKTEVVGIFSREGRTRGFGPSFLSHWARQLVVRRRLTRPESALDRKLLSLRSALATRDTTPGAAPIDAVPGQRAPKWVRRLNHPIDNFFNRRDMGEQLRIIARRL